MARVLHPHVAVALLGLCLAAHSDGGPLNCTGAPLPKGRCWSDPGGRVATGSAASAAECCKRCAVTPGCGCWVLWAPSETNQTSCWLYRSAAPSVPCRHAGVYTVGVVPPPPPPPPPPPAPPGAKSVIMVAVDDMRPELGGAAYGCAHMKTPHFDAFASDALVFDQAYVAVAWCSPSRTALLTSRRPDTTRTWSVVPSEYWRDRGGNFTTLPQVFVERGYATLGVGKIFHPGAASGNDDVAWSWSPETLPYDQSGSKCPSGGGPVECSGGGGDDAAAGEGAAMSPGANPDVCLAACANSTLHRLAERRASDTRPFFFAVGFHKPHIPWTVPQQWYDLYPLDEVELAPSRLPPEGVPSVAMNDILNGYWADAFSDFHALRANGSITAGNPFDNSTLDEYWSRRARQAYWAAISFTDDNFGRVMAAAKATGIYDSAVIVLWGDHGYQLGDNDQWSKVTNFEQATRIPLVVRAPGGLRGARSTRFFEAVDLMPTVVDLAMGVAIEACSRDVPSARATWLCTDGVSAAGAVTGVPSPSAPPNASAFSQVPRGNLTFGEPGNVAGERFMGYSVRQDEWRYTEWVGFDPDTGKGNWSRVVGVELYRHDPQLKGAPPACDFGVETVNVAGRSDVAAVQAELARRLRSKFDIQK